MKFLLVLFYFLIALSSFPQQGNPWHGIKRKIHYQPDGEDFLLTNGSRRFNRALYGGNTAFRVEAGDLPEFALYLPGMGGNLKFGLIKNGQGKWLIDADTIETRYRAGSMIYTIKDGLLGNGTIRLTVLSLFDSEGLIIQAEAKNIGDSLQLIAAYGGATGQKFSRDGDIGADPESSFYLKPEYCSDNIYSINKSQFSVFFGSKKPLTEEERYEIQNFPSQRKDSINAKVDLKTICGIFPSSSQLKIADATQQQSPDAFYQSKGSLSPALAAQIKLETGPIYFLISNAASLSFGYDALAALFQKTEEYRRQIADRIKVVTPDPYINTVGGALSMAADAIWEDPSYLHGAVAWRMRLNGWRGAYTADVLGWHDRAEKHFSSYALSQLTSPLTGPVVMDTALHLARGLEKLGTSLFSSGYISRNPNGDLRPHHYDMNMVFVDQLLDHFFWTGDTAYVRKMWPLLVRHLQWEKRNFDRDGDGLYDAYAAIWASDALQYSGGGVTHSSAYHYRANTIAAELAKLIGEDGTPYQKEANKILKAMNAKLWLKDKGWFAEYRDLLGNQLVHPAAGLWTIYHAMDSHVPDAFQSYQMLRYVDEEIPHIPIRAEGLEDTTLYTLSTTNWQPYTWSLNNVALAELLHTSLAYWQGGSNEKAYALWKSSLVESMYLGASPGNFQQLSFYDAIRGELYRDFADVIGMTSRSLVEGLFGIEPDLLHDRLFIRPGFPDSWNHASIKTPDIEYSFQRDGNSDKYLLSTKFNRKPTVVLQLKARLDDIESIVVNGKKAQWSFVQDAIGRPEIKIVLPATTEFTVDVKWKGRKIEEIVLDNPVQSEGKAVILHSKLGRFSKIFDPQGAIRNSVVRGNQLQFLVNANHGNKTFFISLQQGRGSFWMPISFYAEPRLGFSFEQIPSDDKALRVRIVNSTRTATTGKLFLNHTYQETLTIKSGEAFSKDVLVGPKLVSGTNSIQFLCGNKMYSTEFVSWDIVNKAATNYEKIDITSYFNVRLTNIFNNQYLSPRPNTTTLQLPTQGIGNWAYPLTTASINDSGLRKRAGARNSITIQQGVPFSTPSQFNSKNIIFTSQWNNYPKQIVVPLKGKSSHAYLLMAGSTNPMQSRIINGEIIVKYMDGSSDSLPIKNPENWWPIEQDYYEDGYAFQTNAPKPVRVYLKTGEDSRSFDQFVTIKGFSNRGIDGGAAAVLDMPLDPTKQLQSLCLKTIANDVVIGLMSITLVR